MTFTAYVCNAQSKERPLTQDAINNVIEKEDLKRKNLEQKIESNAKLIEERRRDFEDNRTATESLQALVYWLFGILLTVLLSYIGIDFFNKRTKVNELEGRIKEMEKSILRPKIEDE